MKVPVGCCCGLHAQTELHNYFLGSYFTVCDQSLASNTLSRRRYMMLFRLPSPHLSYHPNHHPHPPPHLPISPCTPFTSSSQTPANQPPNPSPHQNRNSRNCLNPNILSDSINRAFRKFGEEGFREGGVSWGLWVGSWEGEGGCGVGQEETERRMEREVERENIHHENHLRHESSPLPVQMVPVG